MSADDSTKEVEYRPVIGYLGYRVGDDGSVWSCWQRHSTGYGGGSYSTVDGPWKRLNGAFDGKYTTFNLRDRHGHARIARAHTLVLEAFIGPQQKGMEACHFPDEDGTNNHLDNLRWGTRLDNMQDRIAHNGTTRGRKHPLAKLTEDKVHAIRHRVADGECRRTVAQSYGISRSTLDYIISGKLWGWLA